MSQYQHYVPGFIMRKYSDYVEPHREDYVNRKEYDKAVKKAKKRARVEVLDFKDGFTNGELGRSLCDRTFGIPDMYDPKIEIALSGLEKRASKIIKAIEKDFFGGKSATVIVRPQKDLLRKFLFIMAYRNRQFHQRFKGEDDDYDSNDREELLAYMRDKALKTPKDVWLTNIQAFIDVDLEQKVECWRDWLMDHAYPGDARWFWKNMTTSYLCFCTLQDIDEEFVLTQNAYGVFEGPCSHRGWTDWHTFAPVNHRLMIVMRSHFLGGISNIPSDLADALARMQSRAVETMTSVYEDPAAAHSWLKDLPVSRPSTSYSTLQFPPDGRHTWHEFTQEDTFIFEFFHLPSTFAQRINFVFMENAVLTDMVVYKMRPALQKALRSYLELEKPGFKIVFEKPNEGGPEVWRADHNGVRKVDREPEQERQAYLDMLERITRNQLGGHCTPRYTLSTPKSVTIVPPFTPTFYKRYKKLGFDDFAKTWLNDERQAQLISRLWIWTNHLVRAESKQIQNSMRCERLKLVGDLHPRRVWLHLRLMRLFTDRPQSDLLTATRDTYLSGLVAKDNGGPEDVVIDYMSLFSPHRVSRAMMRASGMRQYSELCKEHQSPASNEEYFMAAMAFVGSIADCDLPMLQSAAMYVGMNPNPLAINAVAAKVGCPETLAHEMWMRHGVHRDFEAILGGNSGGVLQGHALQRLKDFVFQVLYPLQ